jgi:hypothetical protein
LRPLRENLLPGQGKKFIHSFMIFCHETPACRSAPHGGQERTKISRLVNSHFGKRVDPDLMTKKGGLKQATSRYLILFAET